MGERWGRGKGETNGDFKQAKLGGEVEGCVSIVGKIGVLQNLRIVAYDAFDENEVVEVESAAKADRGVDHG